MRRKGEKLGISDLGGLGWQPLEAGLRSRPETEDGSRRREHQTLASRQWSVTRPWLFNFAEKNSHRDGK